MHSQAKAESPLAQTGQGHHESKVKSVIFLFMDGGVSHVDSFDPKPALEKHEGEPWSGDPMRKWVKSPWKFSQHGQSGTPVSELFPHIAYCVDDIAVIRSMKADLPIHSTGVLLLNTGHNLAGRPSLGSWINYGLGTENENLPGYVVLSFGHVPVGDPEGFSVFLAGGGVRGGMVYGATDEFGLHAVEQICDMHDLHATILHLCGIDHEQLTFRSGGRDFRLTDVHGKIIRGITY